MARNFDISGVRQFDRLPALRSSGYRWAEPALPREHDLLYFDGQVHFPDYRIEYEADGRERHEDIELFTPHYRGAHAAAPPVYGRGRSAPHPRACEFL